MIDQINILDCVDIINNSVVSYEGMRGYLDTGGLKSNKIVEIRDFNFNDKPSRANQNVEVGDIILARMKATTKVKVISQSESELMVSTGFIVLRPKRTIIDSNFLNHTLISPFFQRKKDKLCSGSTQKAINNGNFKKLKIPLPPLDHQKKIAAILDAADAYRQKTKALIEKYDELTQSLFLEMFGDFIENPKDFKQGLLGEILTEKNSIKCGPFGSQLKIGEFVEEGNPVYGIDNVQVNKFVKAKPKFITDKKYKDLIAFNVIKDDILITRTGTVGRTCLAPDLEKAVIGPNLLKVRIQNSSFRPEFLAYAFNYSSSIIRQIDMFSPGATVAVYNTVNLKRLKVVVPPISLQDQFTEKVLAIESQKAQAQASLAQAEDLFNSLLQRAFKGELV